MEESEKNQNKEKKGSACLPVILGLMVWWGIAGMLTHGSFTMGIIKNLVVLVFIALAIIIFISMTNS